MKSIREIRDLVFNLDRITNDYIGTAKCPFCGKIVEYQSYESASTIGGCNHICRTQRVENPLGLQVVFEL